MSVIPYKAPELSHDDIDVLNELILSKRLFSASKKNSSQKIRFSPSSPQWIGTGGFSFSLTVDQQEVDLLLEPTLGSTLAQRLQELGGVESFPEEFRVPMMALINKEVLDAFENLIQLPVALSDKKESSIPQDKKELYFEVLNEHSISEARGKITLPLSLLKKIISLASHLPSMKDASPSHQVFQGDLIIGKTQLPLAMWEKLAPGALLLLDEPSAMTTGQLKFLLQRGDAIPLKFDLQKLSALVQPLAEISSLIQKSFSEQNIKTTMKPKSVFKLAEADEGQGVDGATKPFTASVEFEDRFLDFEFSTGTLSLSLDEILSLIKTGTVAKSIPLLRPLKILVQGKLGGAGELIKIKDRYALFITEWTTVGSPIQ
ncbi:MAG TPA: hypothetical protein VJK54_03410 [Chthoniobacterales bacterium]|nr:hypothetical protein [Chthoniobacterales bacterium]